MYKQIIVARKDLDMSPGKTRGTGESCKYGFFNIENKKKRGKSN